MQTLKIPLLETSSPLVSSLFLVIQTAALGLPLCLFMLLAHRGFGFQPPFSWCVSPLLFLNMMFFFLSYALSF